MHENAVIHNDQDDHDDPANHDDSANHADNSLDLVRPRPLCGRGLITRNCPVCPPLANNNVS